MAVLEPQEVDKHTADSALVTASDPSLTKFDSMLRAQRFTREEKQSPFFVFIRATACSFLEFYCFTD